MIRYERGFSLVEMAIVLVIIGVLIGGLVTPFSTQLEAGKRKAVESQLRDINEALVGFAASTGRLPCPATTASNGLSAPNAATLVCTGFDGYVPVRTLGLNGSVDANDLLLDPWLNPVRYRLSSSNGGAYASNITLGMVPDIRTCADSACVTVLADTVVAVVYSTGDDGTATTSADQLENLDGDTTFVKRGFSEATGAEFDDHLVWISPNTLTYQLVRAGQLN